jgi:RNA polymerase sigma-70 factor (ECF subfamily)
MYNKNSSIYRLIAEIFHKEVDRILASLISSLRDFELAEDVLQDALLVALERWPAEGVPSSPGAWLTTVARRKAIDRLRRESVLARKQEVLQQLQASENVQEERTFSDERLKLMFTCCHPALSLEAQVALTLQTLGGLSTQEIARAFLVPLPTMAQRLVRAKRKIRDAGIPYRVPEAHLLVERVDAILAVLYLIFNEGYMASSGRELMRLDLCREAIRLVYVLNNLLKEENLLEQVPEALGLQALLILHFARRNARIQPDGELVLLEEQDRSLWKLNEVVEGLAALNLALSLHRPGPFQLQAAISALHIQARKAEQTDWPQIATLYEKLWRMQPSPVIQLNRAVAVAMAYGAPAGLALLDQQEVSEALRDYHLYHVARADLLRRSGQGYQAREAYERALSLCHNERERTFLIQRMSTISASSDSAV